MIERFQRERNRENTPEHRNVPLRSKLQRPKQSTQKGSYSRSHNCSLKVDCHGVNVLVLVVVIVLAAATSVVLDFATMSSMTSTLENCMGTRFRYMYT